MPTCFVMQPFDGGDFDKRYKEVFAPAIQAADLEPYRVDQDPRVSIPVDDIERGIRQAKVCLAEITLDNPNVWFELGYAIACKKEVVLICAETRTTKFPFDVQHRTIIKYGTGSPSHFEELKGSITAKLKAYIEKSDSFEKVSASEITQLAVPSIAGALSDHEVITLAAITQNLAHDEDHVTMHQIHRDLEASGYTRVAATLGVKLLVNIGLVSSGSYTDPNDQSDEPYRGYKLTPAGWDWVLENKARFALRSQKEARQTWGRSGVPAVRLAKPTTGFDDMDDDIPF